jgi:murein hydrolase activator
VRRFLLLFCLIAIAGGPVAAQDERQALAVARASARAAQDRAEALSMQAEREGSAAERSAARRRALAARVEAAEADLMAAHVRVALVAARLAEQRAELARAQAPATQLLGGLAGMARQPAVVAVAQPGSIADLVHLRAVLGAALPAVERRTAALREALARTRALQADAALAARALRDGRARLEADRTALAVAEAAHRRQAERLRGVALSEGDRALALGERARDLVDRMAAAGEAAEVAEGLGRLPAPLPRPLPPGAGLPARGAAAYRLPAEGRLLTGFGEVSAAGVRSRGLALAVAPGRAVAAPAAGVVRFARTFRDYGVVVIIDHGAGWSTTLTGLAGSVRSGAVVAAGATVGRAQGGDRPLGVELRRQGRPVDLVALL